MVWWAGGGRVEGEGGRWRAGAGAMTVGGAVCGVDCGGGFVVRREPGSELHDTDNTHTHTDNTHTTHTHTHRLVRTRVCMLPQHANQKPTCVPKIMTHTVNGDREATTNSMHRDTLHTY